MLIQRVPDIRSSEITAESVYMGRRGFIKTASTILAAAAAAGCTDAESRAQSETGSYNTTEPVTPYDYVISYNNYYEFGTLKSDPAKNAQKFRPQPWTVSVKGLVKKPAAYALDDLIKGLTLEDRIYRMRCVEGWSMVIPWRGFPLAELVNRLEPLPSAKYVEFRTIVAPDQMPGQRSRYLGGGLNWPYIEGLRMDEAMHPLTLIATGIFGKPLPNQNGAPLRLVVPWKYGFKGIKAIVDIRFVEKQPVTSWMEAWPEAYGFYSNVNPKVDHPNHTQSHEERLGPAWNPFLGGNTRTTLMFNGYADQVASLYAGMDLRKYY